MEQEPTLKRKILKWVAIWSIWTLFGFVFASQFALQNQYAPNPHPLWRILSWQMFSGYVWFAMSPLIYVLGKKFPLEKGKWRISLVVHFFASFVFAGALLLIDSYFLPKLGLPVPPRFPSFADLYKYFIFSNIYLEISIYWTVLGLQQGIKYYRKNRERELRTSQLEARLALSRLQVLKMQLHPHFLFNTLNAISELMYKNPDAAERMISHLSDLLRLSFENLEVQEISLKQELEFLRKYLEIEQMRFEDRLKVEMNISPDTLDAGVPNMILQPLVENAIKHGLAPRAEGGTIEIGAVRNNGHLDLTVSDNGIGVPFGDLENLDEGVGLSNTRRRLRHLYGDTHTFTLTNIANGGLDVNLTIPFKEIEGTQPIDRSYMDSGPVPVFKD
jgi:two-component system, LytTR family, sensor kinase